MLNRKISDKMLEWKNNHRNTCLIITGARQVGKTFIIREFGKNNYKAFFEFNFLEKINYINMFQEDLSVENILTQMSFNIKDFNIIDGSTLIFLDEIQACPNAITALKFLAQDKRFDFIASGSLLGMAYNRSTSFPVGYVERMNLNSLDFEEYLWARGINDNAINYLKNAFLEKKTIDASIHNKMLDLFKEFIVVGGMPDVVTEFILSNNYNKVLNVQRRILNDYKDDIIKYASIDEKPKIKDCFNSIPSQLSKVNKKFQYSLVKKNSRREDFNGSLEWLYDAGIINFCYNLKLPESPLEGNKMDDCFKVYMRDTGLLVAMLDDGANSKILSGDLGIYKGAIYENIIADVFTKLEKKLYYFEKNSTLEIDFITIFDSVVTAVEVKSADNTKSKSLKSVIENYGVLSGLKLSSKNIGVSKNSVISLPIYMSMFL